MTILILLGSLIGISASQELTLPELARLHAPGPLFQSRTSELVFVPMGQVLSEADLVVHGTVERADTYLAVDQMDLFTDYVIKPLRIISQRAGTTSDRPGQVPPIVVKRWGGTMVIEGVQVTQENHDLRAFEIGEQLVILLTYNPVNQKYGVTSDTSGTFSVEATRLKPLIQQPPFAQVRPMTVAEFEVEVHRLKR